MPLLNRGWGHHPWGHLPWGIGQTAEGFGRSGAWEQWQLCARCDFPFPLSQLRLQTGGHGGIVVCIVNCLDEPSRDDMKPDELPTEGPLEFIDEQGPSV